MAAIVLLGAGGWLWYTWPVNEAHAVGVEWRQTMRRATCRTTWSERACTTLSMPALPSLPVTPSSYVTLQFSPITRHALWVRRTEAIADSTQWLMVVDSARRALEARSGEPLPCDSAETRFPVAEAWRLGSAEERLYAGWVRGTRYEQRHGYVGIQLVPLGAAGCGRIWHTRLATPAEAIAQVRDWFATLVGVDMRR